MKKHILLSTSMMALLAVPSYSQSVTESEGKFTVTPSFSSCFMDRGARLSGPAFQTTVEYSKGPLALQFFGNFPTNDEVPGSSDPQLDFDASYSWSLTDAFSIKPGITLSTFPRADKDDGFYKATYETYVSFGYALGDANFSLNLYYDLVMKGATYEFGVDYTIPVKPLNLDVELFALFGTFDLSDSEYNKYYKIRNKGDYFQAGLSVPIEISKNTKLIASWFYCDGSNIFTQVGNGPKEPNPHVGHGVFSVGFSYSF